MRLKPDIDFAPLLNDRVMGPEQFSKYFGTNVTRAEE